MRLLGNVDKHHAVDWKAVGIFLTLAFTLAYALDALIFLSGGLSTPLAAGLLIIRMFTPLMATVIVCRRGSSGQKWTATVGLSRKFLKQGAWKRELGISFFGMALVATVFLLVMALAIIAGWLTPDWQMSAVREVLGESGTAPPPAVLGVIMVIQALVAGFTINGLVSIGEEVGWRGWLFDAVAPLGGLRRVLFVGVAWGLWHAPLIAGGYNYSHQLPAVLAIILFTAFCVAFGAVLIWLRQRSRSIFPVSIAHGAFNAFATLPVILVASGETLNFVWAGLVGLPATLIFTVVALLLFFSTRSVRNTPVRGM